LIRSLLSSADNTLTDIALSILSSLTPLSMSKSVSLISRLMLDVDKLVSLQAVFTSVPLPALLKFTILALNFAHSLSTYLLVDGATCLHLEEAAGGGAVELLNFPGVLLKDFNSTLGVFGLELKTEMASVKSGLERLKFSRDLAVSRLKFFSA